MQPSLRGLKACSNLRWSDFTVQSTKTVRAGKRIFYPAVWTSNQGPVNVTLMMYKEQMASQMVCQQSVQPQTLCLNAITEFCDLVPRQQFGEDGDDLVQGKRYRFISDCRYNVRTHYSCDNMHVSGDRLIAKHQEIFYEWSRSFKHEERFDDTST